METPVSLADYVTSSSKATRAYLRWLEIRTEDFVNGRWNQIEAVAQRLIAAGKEKGDLIGPPAASL